MCDIHIATISNSCDFWIKDINMCDIHISTINNSCDFWIKDIKNTCEVNIVLFSLNRSRSDTETDILQLHSA